MDSMASAFLAQAERVIDDVPEAEKEEVRKLMKNAAGMVKTGDVTGLCSIVSALTEKIQENAGKVGPDGD